MQQHAVSGLALAAVTGDGIPVGEMRVLLQRERDRPAGIEIEPQTPASGQVLNRREFPIGDLALTIWSSELDPVADGEGALGFAIHRDALQPSRIIGHLLACRTFV